MQVETYEIDQPLTDEAGSLAADAEAIDLVQQLGLKGQLSLCDTDTLVRNPYSRMTREERAVYTVLYPERTELGEYRESIIPLRVLQIAAHWKTVPKAGDLYVWHPERVRTDPLLVGYEEGESSYSSTPYLLARWGTALQSFATLRAEAVNKFKRAYKAKLSEIKSQITGLTDETIEQRLLGLGDAGMPNLYL